MRSGAAIRGLDALWIILLVMVEPVADSLPAPAVLFDVQGVFDWSVQPLVICAVFV